MREILFRGKTIKTGKWVEGLLWKKKYKSNKWFISCFPDKDDNEECFVVDPETVCQFTGLTDENGVKIWEGDVIEMIHSNFVGDDVVLAGKVRLDDYELMWSIEHSHEVKVIGNIFDHPELMEGGGSDE